MRSAASYFSVSFALVAEDLRRFKAIPLFGFLAYFFAGVFPFLFASDGYYGLDNIFKMQHPGYILFGCLLPVITATALFNYLRSSGSVSVIHALPFTRRQLFNSHFLAGVILNAIPLVLTFPLFIFCYIFAGMGWVFDSNPFIWFALSLLLIIFIYAVCVLASVVTGNIGMHLLACGLLNALLPALFFIVLVYCQVFLFGFDPSGDITEIGLRLAPFIYIPYSEALPGAGVVCAYVAVFAILVCLASFLYTRAALEKAGDSVTFRFMEAVICVFAAFLGMSAMGYYFWYTLGGLGYFYAGILIGAAIAFALARIVIKKTPRIFNRESLVQFGAILAAIFVFLFALRIDLFGYERRVPDPDAVRSVSFNMYLFDFDTGGIMRSNYGDAFEPREAENIRAVTALHAQIVAHKRDFVDVSERFDRFYSSGNRYDGAWHDAAIAYTLKTGGSLRRNWSLPVAFLRDSEQMRAIYGSKEFKDFDSVLNPELGTPGETRFVLQDFRNTSITADLSVSQRTALLRALDADRRAESYESFSGLAWAPFRIDISYTRPSVNEYDRLRSYSIPVRPSYANTLTVLRDLGFYDLLASANRVTAMTVSAPSSDGGARVEEGTEIAVENTELIRRIPETAEIAPVSDNAAYWVVRCCFKPLPHAGEVWTPGASGEAAQPFIPPGEAESLTEDGFYSKDAASSYQDYYDSDPYGGWGTFYLNPGNPAIDLLKQAGIGIEP